MDKYKGQLKLIALVIVLPVVVFFGAIRATLTLSSAYRANKSSIEKAGETETIKSTGKTTVVSGDILNAVRPCLERHNLTVIKYIPHRIVGSDDVELMMGELVVEGRFVPLTLLVRDIENNNELGVLNSVGYDATTDQTTKKRSLRATLFIEQIVKK